MRTTGGYELSVKGWFVVQLMSRMTADEATELWDKLGEVVGKKAADDGHRHGIPCLVFDGGGKCMTVTKKGE